jgi:hypothetical protein
VTALLSRTYDLPLVTLSLDVDTAPTPPEPRGIRLTVEAPGGAREEVELPLLLPVDLPGIAAALEAGTPLQLPPDTQHLIRATLVDLLRGEPIWLEFERPWGYLPVLPWERILAPALPAPLLRLPLSAVPAPRTAQALRIAVCAPAAGTEALETFLATVVPQLPAGTEVEVFAAAPGRRVAAAHPVTVHEPPVADLPVGDELESPWMRWIAAGIAPRSVDVVHVIAPGRLSRTYGMLDLGDSPAGIACPSSLRLVSTGQLLACLTHVGAWSVSLGAIGGEAAVRLLAHRMTALVSGPVLLGDPGADPQALAAAMRYLYTHARPHPPETHGLMVSCHPGRVHDRAPAAPAKSADLQQDLEHAIEQCTPAIGDGAPAWAAANQRLLERWTADMIGLDRAPGEGEAAAPGVSEALHFISTAIEESAS